MSLAKPCEKVTPTDFQKYPIWKFDIDNEDKKGRDETWVVPVKKLPISDASGCVCDANATLACGQKVVGTLSNIELKNARRTEQFLLLSIWLNKKWWHLARYFDHTSTEEQPPALVRHLGLSIDEVFPISYDIGRLVIGPVEITKGKIFAEPRERLTNEQRMALIFD